MVKRDSALKSHYSVGKYGIVDNNQAGVILKEIPDLILFQLATWHDTIDDIEKIAMQSAGCQNKLSLSQASVGKNATLIRTEPTKWWVIGVHVPQIDPEKGSSLDLSHSRTHIQVSGVHAAEFLNRHLSLDLREKYFPVGSVGSTVIHHVGITLWRSDFCYELFIPRGFALSLWQGFVESAKQFGLEILHNDDK